MTTHVYVTTTIPYVNARPHIGFALELVQADALSRYHRLKGRAVRFQTGTDDNAFSNVLSARNAGVPVARFVDGNSEAFSALCAALDISHDRFQRTTEARHHAAVASFISRLRSEDTYVASYRGFYCHRCEDFYLDRDAVDARCPEHGVGLEVVEEANHFFRLSNYQSSLYDIIGRRELLILPAAREKEVLRFIESGLDDFSISRSAERAGGWGVPFPGDADQVVYVWVDALINYLSGLGFPEGTDLDVFWSEKSQRLHVIGKNVWKFHAIYWPALLLSAGLPIPSSIFSHGFLTEGGRKISKTAGNGRDPQDYVRPFGADAVRHFLLAHARPFDDTDFCEDRVAAAYRSDLANGLGNLCSRLTALCERADIPGVPRDRIPAEPAGLEQALAACRFDLGARLLWDEVRRLNQEIAAERPWEQVTGEEGPRVEERLREWVNQLHRIAYWLQPFLPKTSATVLAALSRGGIKKAPALFPRIPVATRSGSGGSGNHRVPAS